LTFPGGPIRPKVGAVHHQEESSAARRLSDLRKAQPGDPTLQNLLSVLSNKLDLCARLPIFEYEAGSQGHEAAADAFKRLAEVERNSFNDLLVCLRRHLDETTAANGIAAERRQ
jgi:hypothetical protein